MSNLNDNVIKNDVGKMSPSSGEMFLYSLGRFNGGRVVKSKYGNVSVIGGRVFKHVFYNV